MSAQVEWLTVPDVAERLGVPVTRVHQLVREGGLAGQREDGVLRVPAGFLNGNAVVKGLSGVLTLLHDGGYDDETAIRWLHHPGRLAAGHAGGGARRRPGPGGEAARPGARALMRVTVNGGDRELPDGLGLVALLDELGLRPGTVVVERNGEALVRSELDGVVLADGDRLELVRAVAGG